MEGILVMDLRNSWVMVVNKNINIGIEYLLHRSSKQSKHVLAAVHHHHPCG